MLHARCACAWTMAMLCHAFVELGVKCCCRRVAWLYFLSLTKTLNKPRVRPRLTVEVNRSVYSLRALIPCFPHLTPHFRSLNPPKSIYLSIYPPPLPLLFPLFCEDLP